MKLQDFIDDLMRIENKQLPVTIHRGIVQVNNISVITDPYDEKEEKSNRVVLIS